MGSGLESKRRFLARMSVRFAAGAALVVAVVAFVFAALLHAIEEYESAAGWSRHSQEVLAAASTLERVAVDLELRVRGYQLAPEPEFMAAWRGTLAELRPAQQRLLRLVADHPGQRRRAQAIAEATDRFVAERALPAIAAADTHPSGVDLAGSTRGAKPRLDAIRRSFDAFDDTERRLAVRRDAAATAAHTKLLVAAGAGIVAIVALLVLMVLRLQRTVARPVRAVAAAAARIAGRDLDARVPVAGTEELAQLAGSFNTMAGSLQRAREGLAARNQELEAQNQELASQRRSLERALARAEELARERARFDSIRGAVLEATAEGIALVGEDGHIDLCNPAMDALLAERELGVRLLDVCAADEPVVDELADEPSGRTFQRYVAPVTNPSGSLGRLIVVRDISRERDAVRAKDEFVATVSHELRTPLTSIVGYLEPVAAGELGELGDQQREFLRVIDRNAQRLLRIVNDLLFVARADAAVAIRSAQRLGLVDVVAESVASVERAACEGGVDLQLAVVARPVVVGDRQRLAQLVDNLLSNAVKFTPRGGRVDVRVSVAGSTAQVEVRDTGIGIPAADLPRLFERFFRARNAVGAAIGGTGLGLSVARQIAIAHAGDVEVESVEGAGTTFRVMLPVAEIDAHPLEEAA